MDDSIFSLNNKTIIIAGGAGQLGFHFATIAAQYNAYVTILDIDINNAGSKIEKLSKSLRDKIILNEVDVCSEDSVKDYFHKLNKSTPVYALVNCFHYKGNTRKLDTKSQFFAPLEEYPLEQWENVIDVNLTGTFLTTKYAIPHLQTAKNSVILNVSSTYGNVSPNPSIYGNSGINSPISYASTKSGIINMTRYLAVHLAQYNIRVNCLSPGGIFNNQSEEFVEKYKKLTPLCRMSNVDDYTAGFLFLLSESNSYMTGSNIIIDGGWTAW